MEVTNAKETLMPTRGKTAETHYFVLGLLLGLVALAALPWA